MTALALAFWTFTSFAFVLGAVVGSFLNVVIYRVPEGQSIVLPASHCPKCDNAIKWYDNIPLLAWLIWLKGRCRHCETTIPAQYFVVELLTAILTALLFFKVAHPHFASWEALEHMTATAILLPFFLYFVFICLLIAITFVDLEHYIIPHVFTLPGMTLGVIAAFVLNSESIIPAGSLNHLWPPVDGWMSVIGLFVGGFTVLAIYIIYYVIRGIEGIGGGDVTLMALMGAWLGWPALIFIFFAASVQGIIAAGIAYVFGGRFLKHSSEIFDMHDEMMDGQTGEKPSALADVPTDEHDRAIALQDGDENSPEEDPMPPGGLAVPFGPFIALAGIEYFFLGEFLPQILSMSYLYSMW